MHKIALQFGLIGGVVRKLPMHLRQNAFVVALDSFKRHIQCGKIGRQNPHVLRHQMARRFAHGSGALFRKTDVIEPLFQPCRQILAFFQIGVGQTRVYFHESTRRRHQRAPTVD